MPDPLLAQLKDLDGMEERQPTERVSMPDPLLAQLKEANAVMGVVRNHMFQCLIRCWHS